MSRNTSMDPPVFQFKAAAGEIRTYRFLTYVFGGGVKVNKHERFFDERTPVRAASIRGQLRFWWRACNPSGCSTLQELRQREGEIWGTTSRPSQVVVEVVRNLREPEKIKVFGDNQRPISDEMKAIAYAAFPLQVASKERKPGVSPGVLFDYGDRRFQLRISYPDSVKNDVVTALWAWETFGGLGARTRRGFGAVQRVSPTPDQAEADIEARLRGLDANPRIEGVPSLSGARYHRSPKSHTSPLDAWKEGLAHLQRLRQGVKVGRNTSNSGKPAGRSFWPEPDEIRRLTRRFSPRHRDSVTDVRAFPRAAFGLPIIFHFQTSGQEPDTLREPEDSQLQPAGEKVDRFASPLILRPIPSGQKHFLGTLALHSPLPEVVLQHSGGTESVACSLSTGEAAQLKVMKDARGNLHTDPIERFFAEIKK